jgi:pimeloyl-ACP methyl ester carboxylesterase
VTTWVLLRGLGREARHWGRFPAELQRRLPGSDAVVTLDLPGNGRRWREPSPTQVAGLVQAARREIATYPHRPPYVLVALSLGGMVALQWAALEHRRVRACVLINSSLGGLSPFWQRLQPGAYAALLGLLLPGRTARSREECILRLTSNVPASELLAAEWTAYAESCPVSRANLLRQLWAAARHRASGLPPPVPTLLLAGGGDRLVSPRCSRAMAQAWGAPLRVHPHAGHDLALDDPEWVVRQIGAWYATRFPP